VNTANLEAAETRSEVERYASETRASAETYAQQARQSADQDASATRAKAEQDARETIEAAQAQARRIVEEGAQRREDIEAVIADLVRRRDDVLDDTQELTAKLTGAVSQHRPAPGTDQFARPDELDPLARDGADDELAAEPEDDQGPADQTELVDAEDVLQDPTAERPGPEQEADLKS
jgi:hypothetical protein